MVVVTAITSSNPHTVNFDQPIQKPSYIRLLSCSLYNSWYNLKKDEKNIFIEEHEKPVDVPFSAGHYTLERLASELNTKFAKHRIELPTDIYTPHGQLLITNAQYKEIGNNMS